MLRKLYIFMLLLSLCSIAVGQVTTSGITGIVTIDNEQAIGATVTARHVASGSQYRVITNSEGRYVLTGLRAGGPYEVEMSYVGARTQTFGDVMLPLGQTLVLDARLASAFTELGEVVVVSSSHMRSDRSGAVTNLNSREIESIPSVGRSLTDLMKMTPQSSSASGTAIGGGTYRNNNVTIDGASFNNAFGIETSLLPGGGTPISLDAIDQLTIAVTPFDVRQSGFTGGAVNAVTKSGTNALRGSAYTYLTSTSLCGARVGTESLPVDDGHTNTYGVTLGGPIVKDKLFVFVNGEIEDNVTTGPAARAGNGIPPYTTTNRRPQEEQLQSLSDYMQSAWGLKTGPWQGFNVKTPTYRVLARVDWNIAPDHKLNVRFTKSNRKESHPASLSRNIGSNRASMIYGGNQNSYGGNSNYGMSSLSSRYYAEYRFTSVAGELNSTFGKLHNTLRGTFSFQDQPRSTEYNDAAPVVEIVMSDEQGHFPTWALTGDLFTYGTLSQTKNTVITDEVNIMLGRHNLFGGIQYEHNFAANAYAQAGAGYYALEATPAEVEAADWPAVFGRAPRVFGLTYGNDAAHSMFTAKMRTNQLSLYVQDNTSWSDRFRTSVGLRLERPTYPSLTDNFNEDYYNIDFGGRHFRTDAVPDASVSLSPRVGFNWDITGQRKFILRGGTGLFVGRMPFVWLISSVLNSGLGQTSYVASGDKAAQLRFTTDRDEMLRQINAQSKTSVPTSPTILSADLRMPRTWKSSLAFDAKLPGDIDMTLEGIFNKDINPVVVNNADIYWDGTSTIDLGHGDVRHQLSYYDDSHVAYVLENAGSKAYYLSLTAQLRKKFAFGLDLSASYTWSRAKSYSESIGDQVSSAYNNLRHSINAVNDHELGYATYVAPHHVLLTATYRLRESKHSTSLFSLVYDGYHFGFLGNIPFNLYSYTFTNCVNGDPTAPGNLIYVPASRQELDAWNFRDGGTVDGQTYTADMQRDDFWHYICQDSYLSSRKGQYAERGGATMPWHNQLDFRYQRDMDINIRKTKHTLQLALDIKNLPNLLCKDWGTYKQLTNNALLTYSKGQYTYNLVDGRRHLTTSQNYVNLVSTYQLMFTIRYLFN